MNFKTLFEYVALSSAVVLCANVAMADDVIRIATEGAYPPFNYKDSDGSLKGFDVDIAKALCDQMKARCVIVAQDWDGMIPALVSHKFDAIVASMSITDDRKKVISFSQPYYRTSGAFLVQKNSGINGHQPADLRGKTIAAQSATLYSAWLPKAYPDSKIRLYNTADEAFLDLAARRVDAVVADQIAAQGWLDKSSNGCCEVSRPLVTDPAVLGEGAGIGVRKSDTELAKRFNRAIDAIVNDGTYKKINAKYFPFNIY
ncbi:transporter substrate-binding domain-containing protein [bacterium M00.F.Ca.ET.228.01.1.1]|uniref:transporter substrate-binding domain-containing protein n=1 Tax=Paraburkholderia phenoliruptrix TaxID=252970 RepID=UPI0010924DB5|nr:transporter substrate-binding domain-containing protein [Paraburkholderia phenoliruptrix]TGP48048.1 transporter substrate-binding domain-containing protein [bacterium M00.F.Ca.ET.228.01.1.1]TGS05840.1 transporter substrate-binding domain-containing protein [bacterium M00.F.Ca.ET.191.01.1.1]TGU10777.1 transporter substrate-binding domain-containing protein [bacterium M00.F.Ca.ET.155.01.1.1]MBW0445128.1 transporter substrate-binding domain-containing protein [Paraburkholderia phenoliruptrix]M